MTFAPVILDMIVVRYGNLVSLLAECNSKLRRDSPYSTAIPFKVPVPQRAYTSSLCVGESLVSSRYTIYTQCLLRVDMSNTCTCISEKVEVNIFTFAFGKDSTPQSNKQLLFTIENNIF